MKSFIDFQKEETELDEEQLDEARGKVVASYIQKAKEAMKKKIDMKRKTAQLNDPNSAEKKIVKESDLDEEQLDEDTKYTPRFEYRQKVQPNIDKHLDDRKTAGAHTAITYHKQSDGSTHAKVQYRNISHTNSSGVGPIQHKHFSVNKDHSVTPIKINEEQLDELSKDTLASYEKKSRVAAHKHALASELKGLAADPAGSYAHKMMADKRHAGWKVAVKKLNTEEVEQIDELSKDTLASYVNKSAKDVGERSHRPDHVKRLKGISVAVNKLSGYQHRDIELPTRKGNHLNRGDSEEEDSNDPRHDARNIDPSKLTKKSDLGSYVNKAAREISGTSYRPNHAEYLQGIRTAVKKLHTEEVELDEEQIEERNKQNAIMRKTMDASRGAKFKARNDTTTPDAEPQHKTAQAHNKAIGRAIRQMSNEEVEIKEAEMTDAEMAKREKIVKGMKKSFKDFTAKYGDRAKEVMYATATKKAMEEEVEEELEEDMDEGAVHKESYESHLANLHKVHQKSGNLEAAIKKVPTKHLQQIHYNNAERADHSVHPITKSAEKELKSRNVPLIEEDMDEGVTTRNGAITVHKGTYGTSYQPNDDEDDEDTPEKKEPAVKRGRGRPAGAKSGAKPKGSSAGKSYGGVAIHSLRLPNNNK